jgi:hypothetical protein
LAIVEGERGLTLPSASSKVYRDPSSRDLLSGGQLAARVLARGLERAKGDEPIEKVSLKINVALRNSYQSYSRTAGPHSLQYFPAASFVIVKVDLAKIVILQGGKCCGSWQLSDGSLGGTVNQMFHHETIKNEKIDFITKEYGDGQKGETEYFRFLEKERRENVNSTYCLLNGQTGFMNVIQKVVLKRTKVKRIVLSSGDALPLEWTKNPGIMSREVFNAYKSGLPSILKASEESFRRRMPTKLRILTEAEVLSLEL